MECTLWSDRQSSCIPVEATNFLTGRKMRTKLKQDKSPWTCVNAGVPQGMLLGPVFSFPYKWLTTSAHMAKYVDDSTLWSVSSTSENSQFQRSAQEADTWADDNLMSLNCDKTKDMVVCFVRKCPLVPAIKLGGSEVEHVSQVKLLGVIPTTSNDRDIPTMCAARNHPGSTSRGCWEEQVWIPRISLPSMWP